MATRHLICVYVNGKYKVAQYGQWDGYPDGQGVDILSFLKKANISLFKEKVLHNTNFITDKELDETWVEAGAKKEDDGFVSIGIADKHEKLYPSLSRNTGAKILELIYGAEDGEIIPLSNRLSFAQDSLFCEWGYVIDLDKNTFEVYEGFNKITEFEYQFVKAARQERFYHLFSMGDKEYAPIKLKKLYELDKLPSKEEFLGELVPKSEAEGEQNG